MNNYLSVIIIPRFSSKENPNIPSSFSIHTLLL